MIQQQGGLKNVLRKAYPEVNTSWAFGKKKK